MDIDSDASMDFYYHTNNQLDVDEEYNDNVGDVDVIAIGMDASTAAIVDF
jgi:hypothetical protein